MSNTKMIRVLNVLLIIQLLLQRASQSSIIIVEDNDGNCQPCYRRLLAGKRVIEIHIRRAIDCDQIEDCHKECDSEKGFLCEGFNYRPVGSRPGGICELTSMPSSRMDARRDFLPDPQYDYYERDLHCAQSPYGPSYRPNGWANTPSRPGRPETGYRQQPGERGSYLPDRRPLEPPRSDRRPYIHDKRPGYDDRRPIDIPRPIDRDRRPIDIPRPFDHDRRPIDIPRPFDHDRRPIDHDRRPIDIPRPVDHDRRPIEIPRPITHDRRPPIDTYQDRRPDDNDRRPYLPDRRPGLYPERRPEPRPTGSDSDRFPFGGPYLPEQRPIGPIHIRPIEDNLYHEDFRPGRPYLPKYPDRRLDNGYRPHHDLGTNEIGPYIPDGRRDWPKSWSPYGEMYGGSYGYDTNYIDKFDVPKEIQYPKPHKKLRPYENNHFYGEFYNYGGAFGYGDNYIPAHKDFVYGGTGRAQECSIRSGAGFKLRRGIVRRSFLTPNLDQCESLCSVEKEFICMTFGYRYSLAANAPTDNCLLSEMSYRDLDFYTDLEPDRDYDIYAMTGNPRSCGGERNQGQRPPEECFWRVRSGFGMPHDVIKKSILAESLGECEVECVDARSFTCRSFVFRYGSLVIDGPPNCFLSDWPSQEIDPLSLPDLEGAELYERGSFGRGCEPYPFPLLNPNNGRPHSNDKHHQKDEVCYSGYHRPCRLTPEAVLSTAYMPSESECRQKCSRMRERDPIPCMSFSYKIANDRAEDNCLFSDVPWRDLRPGLDYVHDDDHLLFAWKELEPHCISKYPPTFDHSSEQGYWSGSRRPGLDSGRPSPGYDADPGSFSPNLEPSFGHGPGDSGYGNKPGGHGASIDSRPGRPNIGPSYGPSIPEFHRPGGYGDGTKPFGDGSYGGRPTGDAGYGGRPIGDGGYGERPIDDGGYAERPVPGGGYGERPIGDGGYGERPLGGNGYGMRPIADGGYHGVRPLDPDRPDPAAPAYGGSGQRPTGSGRPYGGGSSGGYDLTSVFDDRLGHGYSSYGSGGNRPDFLYPDELSTFEHFTVNGYPCKRGTKCERNKIVGFWSCEPEGGDFGTWDYCCEPNHHCGYSHGFHYPWCYVGPAEDQWRPCSEKYYPYLPSPRPVRPSHNRYDLEDRYGDSQRPDTFGRHWPVAYLHREAPPNATDSLATADNRRDRKLNESRSEKRTERAEGKPNHSEDYRRQNSSRSNLDNVQTRTTLRYPELESRSVGNSGKVERVLQPSNSRGNRVAAALTQPPENNDVPKIRLALRENAKPARIITAKDLTTQNRSDGFNKSDSSWSDTKFVEIPLISPNKTGELKIEDYFEVVTVD